MSPQAQQAQGLHIPLMFGGDCKDSEISTAVHVLTFLSESFAEAKGEQPFSDEASFGLVLILDGVIEALQAAARKM